MQTAFLFEVLNFQHLTSLIRRLKIPLKECCGDSPAGPVAKNLSCNAGHMGSIPHQGTRILHALKQGILPMLQGRIPHVATKTQGSQIIF